MVETVSINFKIDLALPTKKMILKTEKQGINFFGRYCCEIEEDLVCHPGIEKNNLLACLTECLFCIASVRKCLLFCFCQRMSVCLLQPHQRNVHPSVVQIPVVPRLESWIENG